MGKKDKIKDDYEAMKEEALELQENPLLKGDGIHICSDGTEVNYKTTARNIRVKLMHLEGEELEEVLTMSKEYQTFRGRLMMLNRKLKGQPYFMENTHWSKAKERSQELLDLFGKMYSGKEVHEIVVNEWKLFNVKYNQILQFQREHSAEIGKLRADYQSNVKNVRLVHKRSRLDELTSLYQSRKSKYRLTQLKSDYELMLKTLEQIRKEVEGEKLTINGRIEVEHEMAVQSHVNSEILKYLNINDIIISRLCARLGVNPKYVLYRLHTSYYSKLTGFLPNSLDKDTQITYPSNFVYDFSRIEELSKELDTEDIEYKEEPDSKDPEGMTKLKQLLLQKLQEKKDSLTDQENRSAGIDGKS